MHPHTKLCTATLDRPTLKELLLELQRRYPGEMVPQVAKHFDDIWAMAHMGATAAS